MNHGIVHVPEPVNEPIRDYAPGSPEKESLKRRLNEMLAEPIEVPLIIGGREVRTGKTIEAVCPHDHGHLLATVHQAGTSEVEQAIEASQEAWLEWSEMSWASRAAIFLKAADLLAGPWRDTLNAATMLNQSKNVYQAEIDSACELVDFWRFNAHYMNQLVADQPDSVRGLWNRIEYRALEGFVFAVTPFNFTAIGGNLPSAPAMMGNVVLWKPASSAPLAAFHTLKLLEEAGLPPGVINFLPGRGSQVGDPVLASPHLAGIHFTGSTPVFQSMWKTVGEKIASYRSYPRIVGETGGKDFIFAHPSSEPVAVATAMVRGAFEYQGQKCSAASRAYIPASLWEEVRSVLEEQVATIRVGVTTDFRNFMGAVIDEGAFDTIMRYVDHARGSADYELIAGGEGDKSKGYFIQPTVFRSLQPRSKLMQEEIFGPVLTVYVYDDDQLDETLELCDTTSPFALTGAIFGRDRRDLELMATALRHAAGNFYINDKPTGAVVGQQPFGGGRASGTNDKAGSKLNLMRWTSVRTIKETFVPPTAIGYPHMDEE